MDLLAILTGSENLYKYLFIGGIGLIILSLFYPLNKKYEYTCQKDYYNNEVKLLNYDLSNLDTTSAKLNIDSKSIIQALSSNHSPSNANNRERQILKDSFNKQYDSVISFRKQIGRKQLDIEYNQVRVETLQNHIKDFTKYETIFFWAGIIASIIGIFGWYGLMKKAPSK